MLAATLFFAVANPATAGLGLTVSPAVISNTWPGYVTLNITGLTNLQPVKVQTFLDLNGNGVVDPGEPLMDSCKVQESGAMVIGGVTNVSAPHDSNPATNAITMTLNFAPPESFDNLTGQKIYRVIAGGSSVTAAITVTNAVTGSYVSGIVYSNGVTPLPNALVVALTVTNQNYVAAAVADNSGHYQLALNPGYYLLLPGCPGYYTDQRLLPQINVTNGMSATNNLSLTNGVAAISGTVYDAVSSNQLAGIFLEAQSGSLFEIAFTDTNGNYSVNVTSNNWKFKVTADRLARSGYVSPQGNAITVSTAAGSVTGANIGLYQGNALFYGNVTISSVPQPNLEVECNDLNQVLAGKGFTDSNGNYGVLALVNTNVLPAGTVWNCSPSAGAQAALFSNFIFNQAENVLVSSNAAVMTNFVGLAVSTSISGRLVNGLGVPITGVGVGANAAIGGLQYTTAFIRTDTNGNFAFGAAPGLWYVNANCCGSDGLSGQNYFEAANPAVTVPPAATGVSVVAYPSTEPVLGQPQAVSASQFDFNLYGSGGNNYTVLTSTNLAGTNWTTLTVVSNLPGSPYLIQDYGATNRARFYRALQKP
jgi:hypothetical protein